MPQTNDIGTPWSKLLVIFLDLAALCVTAMACFGCNLFKITFTIEPRWNHDSSYYEEKEDFIAPQPGQGTHTIGLWTKQDKTVCGSGDPPSINDDDGCSAWGAGNENFDAPWKFARAMILVTLLLGFFLLPAVTCSKQDSMRLPKVGFHFLLAVFSLLVLVSKTSEIADDTTFVESEGRNGMYYEFPVESSEIGGTFYLPVVASVLWIVSGLLVLVCAKDIPRSASSAQVAAASPPADPEHAPSGKRAFPSERIRFW